MIFHLQKSVKFSVFAALDLHHKKIQDHKIMVSFHVESLFTNVPIKGDPGLADHTTLTSVQIEGVCRIEP